MHVRDDAGSEAPMVPGGAVQHHPARAYERWQVSAQGIQDQPKAITSGHSKPFCHNMTLMNPLTPSLTVAIGCKIYIGK